MITGKYPSLRLRRSRKNDWSRRLIEENNLSSTNNIKIEDFNGELFTEIYDKVSSKLTLGDESTPFPYREWDNLIFKGISSVNNGSFNIEFVVPSSIEYDYG